MNTREWIWRNARGLTFQARAWEPDRSTRAVVALVHGLGEHTGRYEAVGARLAAAGYALVGFDLRGHGLSSGPRGHTPDYDALLDDISDFLTGVSLRFGELPLYLYGHSLGGNLVINFALRRPSEVCGVIAASPWLRLAFEPWPPRLLLARLLNLTMPAFTQGWDLQTGTPPQDLPVVEVGDPDPLVHDRISARLFVTVSEAGRWALENAEAFPLPLLLMHGSADQLTSAKASAEFAASAGGNVTWRCWDGLAHELHAEASREKVLQFVMDWLESTRRGDCEPRHRAGQKASAMREFGALS